MVSVCVLAAGLTALGSDPLVADRDPVPFYEITTSQFAIPVKVSLPGNVTAVDLYVSTDRGETWVMEGRVRPDGRPFLFHAPKSGEYWFAPLLRLTDGNTSPADIRDLRVNLRVRVTLPDVREVSPPPLNAPTAAKPRLETELDSLDEELNRLEMDLIRKELRRLTRSEELTPETIQKIDGLRARLAVLRSQVTGNRSCAPPYIAPPTVSPDLPPPSPGPTIPAPGVPPANNPPPLPLSGPVYRW